MTFHSRFALFLLALALSAVATPASAIVVLSPSGQPFDFNHQVRNRWNGSCNSYTYWGSPWFVQAPECDRYVGVDATGLQLVGYQVRDAEGNPIGGFQMVSTAVVLTTPDGTDHTISDGWQMLALLDSNSDGQLNANDTTWPHMRLLADGNGDSAVDPGEEEPMFPGASIGVSGGPRVPDALGNQRSDGTWDDGTGTALPATDVVFAGLPAVEFGGLDHYPLGTASLARSHCCLTVSNIGSSGDDGVSLDLAPNGVFAQGATVDTQATNMNKLLWDYGLESTSSTSKQPTAVEYAILVSLTPGVGSTAVDLTPPSGGPSLATIRVKQGQSLVHLRKAYDLNPNDLSFGARPSSISGSTECSPTSTGDAPFPCVETAAITFNFDTSTSISIPGSPTVTGDQVQVILENETQSVAGVCHVDMFFDGALGSTAQMASPSPFRYGMDLRIAGQARARSSLDSRLVVSNIGSSGEDGVIFDLDENIAGMFNLGDIPGGTPAGHLELRARGDLSGTPDSFLGSLRMEPDALQRMELTYNYTPLAMQKVTVQYIDSPNPSPNVVAEYEITGAQIGSIFVSDPTGGSPGWPSACGKTFAPDPLILCYAVEWPEQRLMETPGFPPVMAEGVRILADTPLAVASLDQISLVAAGLPGGEFEIQSVRNTVPGPDSPILQIAALGISPVLAESVDLKRETAVVVPQFSDSGDDGVRIDFDPADPVLAVNVDLPPLNGTTIASGEIKLVGEKGGTEDINIGIGELQECTISKSTDPASPVRFTPNFLGPEWSDFRLRLWRDNVLRLDVPIVNGQEACNTPEWPENMSLAFEMDPAGNPVCYLKYKLERAVDVSFPLAGGGMDVRPADHIELVAKRSELPMNLKAIRVQAASMPYLTLNITAGGGNVTAAPIPSLGAAELLPNSPNPFNPTTSLHFNLSRSGPVELSIYSLDGRRVDTLISGPMPAGDHRQTWHGTDSAGKPVASGTYLVQLRTEEGAQSRKIALVK